MTHYFSLHNEPFCLIAQNKKHIEMRLYDEKRKVLLVGDEIVFTNNQNQETLTCTIEDLKTFKSFKELYDYYPKELLGYREDEEASFEDMYLYYKKEQIDLYGVIAIKISKK